MLERRILIVSLASLLLISSKFGIGSSKSLEQQDKGEGELHQEEDEARHSVNKIKEYKMIVHKETEKCLDINTNGDGFMLYECNQDDTQMWFYCPMTGLIYSKANEGLSNGCIRAEVIHSAGEDNENNINNKNFKLSLGNCRSSRGDDLAWAVDQRLGSRISPLGAPDFCLDIEQVDSRRQPNANEQVKLQPCTPKGKKRDQQRWTLTWPDSSESSTEELGKER